MEYSKNNQKSKELYNRALKVLTGGVSRNTIYRKPHPSYVKSVNGSYITDVDGNSRIDFANNMASLIHGYDHPEIINEGIDDYYNGGNALYTDTFTGNGSTTAYSLGITPVDLNAVEVYLNGLYQNVSTLTLSGNTLTFATAPPNGVIIEVRSVGFLNSGGTLAPATLTGGTGITVTTNSPNNFTIAGGYTVNVINSDTAANNQNLYVFTASAALTLPAGADGNSIKISNRSGTTTCTLVPNGTDKIMGSNTTMTLNTASASFELIFSGTAQGWVIIGQ